MPGISIDNVLRLEKMKTTVLTARWFFRIVAREGNYQVTIYDRHDDGYLGEGKTELEAFANANTLWNQSLTAKAKEG
jgi:hypothetical protein